MIATTNVICALQKNSFSQKIFLTWLIVNPPPPLFYLSHSASTNFVSWNLDNKNYGDDAHYFTTPNFNLFQS